MGIVTFILVLSLLVFIHELGHFLAARYFGVKVEVFSIGFGKEIVSKQYGDTVWKIAWIPLGGYVKMKGQDDLDPSKQSMDKESYNTKTPLQRIVILLAGPLANILLAAFLYFCIALLGEQVRSPIVGSVLPDYPAYKAGLQVGDKIVQINQTKIRSWRDLSDVISSSHGPLTFYIERDGKLLQKYLNTQLGESQNHFRETIQKKMIGIRPDPNEFSIVRYSFTEAFVFSYEKTVEASQLIVLSIKKLIEGIIPTSEIGGVISIGHIVSQVSQSSFVLLLTITALISVQLGILNLLPIPALDGGHIIFNLYELITHKKPNTQVLIYLTIMGWVILLGLMLLGLYNDINRLLFQP